jgi:hypothetical protein
MDDYDYNYLYTSRRFKREVRNAVNDQLFWSDMINNHFRRNNLNKKVDDRILEKLPSAVKSNLDNQLPGLIALQMNKQLPNWLENNRRMQNILDTQLTKVEKRINEITDRRVKEVLSKNEDIIGNNLRDIHNQKFIAQMNEMKQESRAQMNSLESSVKSNVNTTIVSLRSKTDEVLKLRKDIKGMQRDIQSTKTYQIVNTFIGLGVGMIGGGTLYHYLSK